jgi:hypothetical protein
MIYVDHHLIPNVPDGSNQARVAIVFELAHD